MMASAHESVALITGAASGIGLAVARELVRGGRAVALCDRDEAALARAGAQLRDEGDPARVGLHPLDVRDLPAVEAVVARVEARASIDAVVLAAGVLHVGEATRVQPEHFMESLAINAAGVFHVARTAVPHMAARGRGALVTVASNAAKTPRLDMAAYCAAKAAAAMYTRCLGLEVARHGVRCNVVDPGSTDTPMLRSMLQDGGVERAVAGDLARYRLGIPLQRVASALDVARAVLFLLSDDARHITLAELTVDGGATF